MLDQKIARNAVYQILDANANRAREGLRVVEEIFRFVLKHAGVSRKMKSMRHAVERAVDRLEKKGLVLEAYRDTAKDPGRRIHSVGEFTRRSVQDVLQANLHRAGEALRVLEEFTKLIDQRSAKEFKELRFRLYDVEKTARLAL